MYRTRIGKVLEVNVVRPGFVELLVDVDGRRDKAVLFPELSGEARVNDRVLLNTTAVHLSLGTGGYHFVQLVFGREERDLNGPGHIMKLRYTPWQIRCQSVEEPGAPGHEELVEGGLLDGMPVIVGELHSQLAPAALMAKHLAGARLRLVYIMTDGAALPIAFSHMVSRLKKMGAVDATITCGHAFGGDAEAVNVYSALSAARRVFDADIAVVCMGPGIVGTGTKYGFTGIEQGPILDAVASLGGVPIGVVRLGFGDQRERHRGISHHTLTVLGEIVRSRVTVPIPSLDAERAFVIYSQLLESGVAERHDLVEVDAAETGPVLRESGLRLTTMGRGLDEEPAFFMAAGAAGVVAVRKLQEERG